MSNPSSPHPSPRIAWKVQLTLWVLRIGSWLPLSWLHALGALIGRLLSMANTREAKVARRNFQLIHRVLGLDDQEAFVRRVMAETGKNLTELALVWGGTPDAALGRIVEVVGREHFQAAKARGKGVIIAAPHLGCWELLNLWLCKQGPTAILYRQPQHAEWEPLLTRSRGKLGAQQIRAEASGVRELLKVLKSGGCTGILPDQRAMSGEGEVAPFLGQPVRSMTLLSRLAHRTDSAVVFGFCERLQNGRGYRLHFLPAEPSIASSDHVAAVTALHHGLAACVERAPWQYQWTYKRFSMKTESQKCAVYRGLK
ncbi:lipid A biosynthesis acyltransferase [Ahniella affigens]|uniref:Lipid A biosynthesis acyltransferase n=1 Tax=Ahniella affigens TaxID=2021234 RepID=A0A2P1PWI2_9GAMM|nr:lipid A biosynthesis acyltransferase [Ahniella affigens]AVP99207.1 lipid A biosynthesis acyltransferase [Ahniella affigens]